MILDADTDLPSVDAESRLPVSAIPVSMESVSPLDGLSELLDTLQAASSVLIFSVETLLPPLETTPPEGAALEFRFTAPTVPEMTCAEFDADPVVVKAELLLDADELAAAVAARVLVTAWVLVCLIKSSGPPP